MKKSTQKEIVWSEFSRALANAIADKFLAPEREAVEATLKDLKDRVVNEHYLPLKKHLDKLPDGVVGVGSGVFVACPELKRGLSMYVRVSQDIQRVPHALFLPASLFGALKAAQETRNEIERRAEALAMDLCNNIVMADSFEEVIAKWPECKELAEECAVKHATTMCYPLSRILGKYSLAPLPAPEAKRLT
jgi:hypothetical protein